MQETQTNNLLNKKVGAMLVATGILSKSNGVAGIRIEKV